MTVTKVGGANMIAHAQWPQCPPFPRVTVFYVTPEASSIMRVFAERSLIGTYLYS